VYLIGEMEPADPTNEARSTRLIAYENAGYRKIDPHAVNYLQPDFRSAEEIDASGGAEPVPLNLLVRKVGREAETVIRAETVHRIASSLYRMYAMEFRPRDMDDVWKNLETFPRGDTHLSLLPPTSA
jgi:hypothetical protein